MKTLARFCLLLVLFLTGCEDQKPLAKMERPDTIRVYSAGSENVITNPDTISAIISRFTDTQRKWERYWATVPATRPIVDIEKGGKNIVRAFVGPDWIIVKADEIYSTSLTKRERDDLIRLLEITGAR